MSVENQDLLNASISAYFFFPKNETKYGPKTKYISFYDFFQVSTQFILFLFFIKHLFQLPSKPYQFNSKLLIIKEFIKKHFLNVFLKQN